MAAGRRREARSHAVTQAALVWSIGECDAQAFIETGEICEPRQSPLDPQLQAAVDLNVAEIMKHGKLIVG